MELNEEITMEEMSQRLIRTSLKDPEHLKKWLDESNRRYLVFDSLDLVDSLPFPAGIDSLMQLIACYRDHRATKPSGRAEKSSLVSGEDVEIPIMKTDVLEVEELDRAIRFLVGQITELDAGWSLENPSR